MQTQFHLRVEMSHAHRRFLDAQRIHNLAATAPACEGGEGVHTCILMASTLDRHHQMELRHPPLPQRTVPPSGGLPSSGACLRANLRAKAKWDQTCQQHVRFLVTKRMLHIRQTYPSTPAGPGEQRPHHAAAQLLRQAAGHNQAGPVPAGGGAGRDAGAELRCRHRHQGAACRVHPCVMNLNIKADQFLQAGSRR